MWQSEKPTFLRDWWVTAPFLSSLIGWSGALQSKCNTLQDWKHPGCARRLFCSCSCCSVKPWEAFVSYCSAPGASDWLVSVPAAYTYIQPQQEVMLSYGGLQSLNTCFLQTRLSRGRLSSKLRGDSFLDDCHQLGDKRSNWENVQHSSTLASIYQASVGKRFNATFNKPCACWL